MNTIVTGMLAIEASNISKKSNCLSFSIQNQFSESHVKVTPVHFEARQRQSFGQTLKCKKLIGVTVNKNSMLMRIFRCSFCQRNL